MTIRLAIIEDQAVVRGALVALLRLEPDLDVIADYPDGESALAASLDPAPDVYLVDIELPGISGIETVSRLREKTAEGRCALLTTFGRPGYLHAAMAAGARGFLVKDGPAEMLADSVRMIAGGSIVIDPELATAALAIGPNPLSPRQRDILRLLRLGRSTADIGDHLALTEGTVRNYLSEAISLTGAANRIEAIHIAELRGWL